MKVDVDDRLYQQDDDGIISESAEVVIDGITRSSTGEIDLSRWKPKPPDLSDISGWRGHWIYISSVLGQDIANEIGKDSKEGDVILGRTGAVSTKYVESDVGVEGYGLPTNPRETLALCKVASAIVARAVQLRGIDAQRGVLAASKCFRVFQSRLVKNVYDHSLSRAYFAAIPQAKGCQEFHNANSLRSLSPYAKRFRIRLCRTPRSRSLRQRYIGSRQRMQI